MIEKGIFGDLVGKRGGRLLHAAEQKTNATHRDAIPASMSHSAGKRPCGCATCPKKEGKGAIRSQVRGKKKKADVTIGGD